MAHSWYLICAASTIHLFNQLRGIIYIQKNPCTNVYWQRIYHPYFWSRKNVWDISKRHLSCYKLTFCHLYILFCSLITCISTHKRINLHWSMEMKDFLFEKEMAWAQTLLISFRRIETIILFRNIHNQT